MSTTVEINNKPRRRSNKASKKINPHVSVAEMMDRVMQTTVSEFLQKIFRDEDILEMENVEEKITAAMNVWNDMTHKPKGMSFLQYPIGLYSSTPASSDAESETSPTQKKKSGYQIYCSVNRPLIRNEHPDMDFGQVTVEVARRWKLLSVEERKAYPPVEPAEPEPEAEAREELIDPTQVDILEDHDDHEDHDVHQDADADADAEDDEDEETMRPETGRWIKVTRDFSEKENQVDFSSNEKNLWKELTKLSKVELLERLRGENLRYDEYEVPEGSKRGSKVQEKAEKTYLANIVMNARFMVSSRETEFPCLLSSLTISSSNPPLSLTLPPPHPNRSTITTIDYTDPRGYNALDTSKAQQFKELVRKSKHTLENMVIQRNLLSNPPKEENQNYLETEELCSLRLHNYYLNMLMNSPLTLPPLPPLLSPQPFPPTLPVRFVEFDEDLIHECKYNPQCCKMLAGCYEIHRELRASHLEHILREHRILYPDFQLPEWASKDRYTELYQEYLLQIFLNAREWELVEDYETWLDYHRRVYYYLSWDEKDAGKLLEPRCECMSVDLTHWDSLRGSMRGSSLDHVPRRKIDN